MGRYNNQEGGNFRNQGNNFQQQQYPAGFNQANSQFN